MVAPIDDSPKNGQAKPEEKVLWRGQSDPLCYRKANITTLRGASILLVPTMAVLVWVDWRNWYLAPLVALALLLIVRDVPTERYEITNQRVALYNRYWLGKQDLRWDQVGNIRLWQRPDGTGGIIFEPSFLTTKSRIRFFCIAQADEVYQIVKNAQQSNSVRLGDG